MPPIGSLSPNAFLNDYWQKKPLLIRDAFPGFRSPLDGDELAGLACEPDVESRIVSMHPGPRYELRSGPFHAADFAGMGDRDWTLLVQDIEKHIPELAPFLDEFSFIPGWRIDDLMISWAADGGSVGPHLDQYDVFLLQAEGNRRWRVGKPMKDPKFLPDHALQVLERFDVEEEWTLEPGDMLYLPPGVPHWGVAEGACMTWSIGFRAPSTAELLHDFVDRIGESFTEGNRYSDPDLTADESTAGRISPQAIERVGRELESAFIRGKTQLPRWFGELVTAPKVWLQCEPLDPAIDPLELRRRVETGITLFRDSRSRLAWMPLPSRGLCLFADGRSLDVPSHTADLLATLCTEREFPLGTMTRYLDDEVSLGVLAWLVNGGQLVMDDE